MDEHAPVHRAPAPAEHHVIDGVAVVRRCHRDLAPGTPAVVFVHGAMDRAASFGRVMRRLPDLDVIAVDRRGYAGSIDGGTAPTLAAHADDVRRVVDWSDRGDVLVVGHSLGGTICLLAAITGMPAVETLAIFEAPMPWLPDYGGSAGGSALDVARSDGPEAAAEYFLRNMLGDAAWDRMRPQDRAARRAEGPALVAELVDLRRPGFEPDLGLVNRPVTVGTGGRSRPHLRRAAAELADQLPDATLVELTDAPHGAHLARPDDFASWVRTALGRVTLPGGIPTAS